VEPQGTAVVGDLQPLAPLCEQPTAKYASCETVGTIVLLHQNETVHLTRL